MDISRSRASHDQEHRKVSDGKRPPAQPVYHEDKEMTVIMALSIIAVFIFMIIAMLLS